MTYYLPGLVTRPAALGANLLRSALGSLSWGPLMSISRAAVCSIFARIENGTLIIIDDIAGTTKTYGQTNAKEISKLTNNVKDMKSVAPDAVELHVRKDAFWIRLFLFGDMGFAEAYMLGEIECSNMTGFFKVCYP